jgi:hypothetical protein
MARLSVEEQPDVAAHVLKRAIRFCGANSAFNFICLQLHRDTSPPSGLLQEFLRRLRMTCLEVLPLL